MRDSSIVVLDGKEHEIARARLRAWLQLEDIHEKIVRAADKKNRLEFTNSIYSYLSVALSLDIDFSTLPWYEIVEAYIDLISLNKPLVEFPILRSINKAVENVPWDYEGRTWHFWAHQLAKSYGWHLDYIAELDIDDAIAHIQEIVTSEQMRKEWEWMLSDKSVSYDKRGKGTFHDYNRPAWMGGKHIPPDKQQKLGDKIPMKKSMIPMGVVVHWKDNNEHLDA